MRRPSLDARTCTLPLLAFTVACGNGRDPGTTRSTLQISFSTTATGLASPVHLAAPAGDGRLFIVEQPGRIRVVKGGQLLAAPFLDITAKVGAGGERGLLSVAFDPAYGTNGHFFVYYTNRAGDITVERYAAGAGADVADAASATPVITIPHRTYANHNGGLAAFGPDGMLYLGTGDGGGGGDPDGNAQDTGSLLGKLLRIDVRTLPYAIPSSNPFVDQAGKRAEIWAYGLRNPWRYAWSSAAGGAPARLVIADVGQGAEEEIDVVRADSGGVNFGWNVMEGARCYTPSSGCTRTGLALPATSYDHSSGACSIIGGYVYRGAIQALRGAYVFSDYCAGFFRAMTLATDGTATVTSLALPSVGNVLGFGEDAAGGLYALASSGTVYKVVPAYPD